MGATILFSDAQASIRNNVSSRSPLAATSRRSGHFRLVGPAAGPPLEGIERADHAELVPGSNMRVDHRRAHVGVTEQLLYGPDVVSVLQEVRRKAVPQGVNTRALGNTASLNRAVEGTLEGGGVHVISSRRSAARINRDAL